MIKTGLFQQSHLSTLKKAVDVYSKRHKITAQNIANVETQGYRTRELKFEDLLSGATNKLNGRTTHSRHLPIGGQDISRVEAKTEYSDTGFDNGVNNVDIDGEMTNLATNDLSYRLATRLLSMRYTVLRGAIKGSIR